MAHFQLWNDPMLCGVWGCLKTLKFLHMQAPSNFHKTGGTQLANDFCVMPDGCWVCELRCLKRFIMIMCTFNWYIAWCNVVKGAEWAIQATVWLNVNCCCSEQRGMFTWAEKLCHFWSEVMELAVTCCATLQITMHTAELFKRKGVYWTCWCVMCQSYLVYAMEQRVLVGNFGVVACQLDPPSDMSAVDMPTCCQRVRRHVGDMSNVATCSRWHQKTSVLTR